MATIDDIYKLVVENRNALNDIIANAKATGDLDPSTALSGVELIRIVQNGVSKWTTSDALRALGGGGEDNVQADWSQSDIGSDDYIKNKPVNLSDFNDDLGYASPEWGNITGTLSDQTDLQVALTGKANISHSHIIGDTTGLQAALDDKIESIVEGTNITVDITDPKNPIVSATLTFPELEWGNIIGILSDQTDLQSALDGKANTSHTHTISQVTNLQTTLDGKSDTSHAHAANIITFTPTGNTAAANVQAAIVELQSDIDTRVGLSTYNTFTNINDFTSAVFFRTAPFFDLGTFYLGNGLTNSTAGFTAQFTGNSGSNNFLWSSTAFYIYYQNKAIFNVLNGGTEVNFQDYTIANINANPSGRSAVTREYTDALYAPISTVSEVTAATLSYATTAVINNEWREINHATGCSVTLNSGVAKRVVTFVQTGAGQITFIAGSGVTIVTAETLKSRKTGSTVSAVYLTATKVLLTGDLELLP